VIDADGQIVAPGFIDLHTHYDAQIFWDPYLTISGYHGVTSVVLGNCGFGFAPVRPKEVERSMLTMVRTEAIPLRAMQAAMPFNWESYPQFMDALDAAPKGVNLLPYVPMNPLMGYVMGIEESKSGRMPTDDEHAKMRQLLHQAMDAGAAGWSAQRLIPNGPASVQRATVPAAEKSMSSGWAVMASTRLISASSSTPAILRGRSGRSRSAPGTPARCYSSGTRVGVDLVRVCFLKNGAPGLMYRQ